ncbi:MAG: CBS domain-containing protein [Thermoguttaceae bacterium]|jgi:CBS domain-containing protein
MVRAKDLMTTEVITVGPDDSIAKAIDLMLEHRVSGLPVVNDAGQLLGIISEFDALELVWDGAPGTAEVFRFMSREVYTIDENADLNTMAQRFRTLGVRRLPVLSGSRLAGIVSRRDLLAHLCQPPERETALSQAEGGKEGGSFATD